MSATQALANLRARFDRVALQPPARTPRTAEQALASADPEAWARLLTWCNSPSQQADHAAWHGKASNDFAVATLCGPAAAASAAWANAFARSLDGSTALEALPGRAAGLLWRARIKLHDAMWWRPRQPSDPWDAGWASTAPPAERQLQHHFLPRRATLILAAGEDSPGLAMALAALAQRGAELQHPLRWLWVGEPQAPAAAHLRSTLTVPLKIGV
ncbi:MAG: hypothetical protein IPP87_15420 [Ideonella sp.]|nr:hypothetical protein [Ideonella sp.]